ncbi:MAG: lipoyl synthase [Bacillota bacterium]
MPSRFPPWMKRKIPTSGNVASTRATLDKLGLNTVCQSAQCPNLGECFSRRTATVMILGNVCTRNCRFCAVKTGFPQPVDCGEPYRIAQAVAELQLRHVVITSVTRDDLPDGGAGHFSQTVRAIRLKVPDVTVEVLTPDFQGSREALRGLLRTYPDIFNHNVETIPRLYSQVRPGADYTRSLCLLRWAREENSQIRTKSGIMVGLGETAEEVAQVLKDLRSVYCDAVTIGQYLQPSPAHLPVIEYIHPDILARYNRIAREMGFTHVAAGPFVRSSYHAGDYARQLSCSQPDQPAPGTEHSLPHRTGICYNSRELDLLK